MKGPLVTGLLTLRLLRLERAERSVNQARVIYANRNEKLAELRLLNSDFKKQQPQREEKHFEEYCSKANEASSLNRYRHAMSSIIEEGLKNEQCIDDAVEAVEKANDAVSVACEIHAQADRSVSKLDAMFDHLQNQIIDTNRRAEEREMDDWLSVSVSSKIRR